MSVDYCTCSCCGKAIYEEFIGNCSKCDHRICTDCLVNDDKNSSYEHDYRIRFDGTQEQKDYFGIYSKDEDEYGYVIGDTIDDVGIDSKYCPFCNNKEVNDNDLLDYAIDKLGTTKKTLIIDYFNNKNNT